MPSNSSIATNYTQIEADRSDDAVLLETINTYLTLFYMTHKSLAHEISEYNTAIDYIRTICAGDEQAETALLVTLAKDFYRSSFGHKWELRK